VGGGELIKAGGEGTLETSTKTLIPNSPELEVPVKGVYRIRASVRVSASVMGTQEVQVNIYRGTTDINIISTIVVRETYDGGTLGIFPLTNISLEAGEKLRLYGVCSASLKAGFGFMQIELLPQYLT